MKRAHLTFRELLIQLRTDHGLTQTAMAECLNISPQYYHDLEHGRRLPSVRVVHNVCDHFIVGSGQVTARRFWHRAGARAHGWEIT